MKVLVTGGAGYIGSVTCRHLGDAGHECVVLDDLSRGHSDAVDARARLVVGSVGDRAAVEDALSGCDAVVHCAGFIDVEESERLPDVYMNVNCTEPQMLLRVMDEMGVRNLVFSSTAAVYGEPETVPIQETSSTEPINPYGRSKLAFERAIEGYAPRGLKAIRFRYFNVAGAMPDCSAGEAHDPETHIIPRVLWRMYRGDRQFEVFGGDYATTDGTCVRDYVHVCDLARAHRIAVEHLAADGSGAIVNLGNGNGYTNLEVVDACARVTGTAVNVVIGPRRRGDPATLVAASNKAEQVLGWVPDYPGIDTIVADAWRWHSRRWDEGLGLLE